MLLAGKVHPIILLLGAGVARLDWAGARKILEVGPTTGIHRRFRYDRPAVEVELQLKLVLQMADKFELVLFQLLLVNELLRTAGHDLRTVQYLRQVELAIGQLLFLH